MAPFAFVGSGGRFTKMIVKYKTIHDIYSANEEAREDFTATVRDIFAKHAMTLPDGEKWTIQQIVEHVSKVDSGIARICGKLIDDAKTVGKISDVGISVSDDLYEKAAMVAETKASGTGTCPAERRNYYP